MKIILKENINDKYRIRDFAINPMSNNLVTVGREICIYNKHFQKINTISKKTRYTDSIKFIKEENQLFASSTFYITKSNNEIYRCDSSKFRIVKKIPLPEVNTNGLCVNHQGKIIYTNGQYLYSLDSLNNTIKSVFIDGDLNDNHSIYVYNGNIILKTRKIDTMSNNIRVYTSNDLNEILNINTETNNTFLKLLGVRLYAGKDNGEVEIWDATYQEMYDRKKISDSKITYIENDDEWFYVGTASGDLIVTNDKFDVVCRMNVFKGEIKKLLYTDDSVYALSEKGKLVELLVVDDDDTSVIKKFLKTFNIHEDYHEFFNINKVTQIENFIKTLNINNVPFAPHKSSIFKALQTPLMEKKVCILGKDPYFQSNVATGLAFEVQRKSWSDKEINTSLKNILKLIYYSYTHKRLEIDAIRHEIDNGTFRILSPDKLFKSWELQGVLLLNTAFTVLIDKPGSHIKFWNQFTKDLLQYISVKNMNITYLLWGKDAQNFDKYIIYGKKIMHNHPAICGNLDNEKDFLNGTSFEDTKDIINWLGVI